MFFLDIKVPKIISQTRNNFFRSRIQTLGNILVSYPLL